MPVSSGICQQKMLDAKFVERKVYLDQSCSSECVRDLDLHSQALSHLKNSVYTALKCGTDFTSSWRSTKCCL